MAAKSIYETVLGQDYHRLPAAVLAFHRISGHRELHGWVRTEAPATRLAQLLALCLGTPRASSAGAIRFELHAHPGAETWVRHFPEQTMTSRLQLQDGVLTESLGLVRLYFELQAGDGKLVMRLTRLRFLGIPCPRWALPAIVAEENGHGGNLYFTVRATLPLVGQVAGYTGHLVLDDGVAK